MFFNICEKLHNDRLRKDRSLGNRNSDDNNPKNKHKNNNNNNNNNNVGSAWRPVSGSKIVLKDLKHQKVTPFRLLLRSCNHTLSDLYTQYMQRRTHVTQSK